MRIYKDIQNYYLSKFLSDELNEKYISSWFFYNQDEIIEINDFFENNEKVYSFLWEYSDDEVIKKIDEWKRALKRNNIEIPLDSKLYEQNYFSDFKKYIYLDIIESKVKNTNRIFKLLNENLTQIIASEMVNFSTFNLTFLENNNSIDRFRNYIKILDLDEIYTIVINGYHHDGSLIKIFLHRKEKEIISTTNILHENVFENTFVYRPFNW